MSHNQINVVNWIGENEKYFLPPICNKLMHNNQLKVFFVGGPNQRKDYHIEEGEEFFYMIKGDMCLKVIQNAKHKDVIIKEGQVFLLPSRVPHSPQRQANTIGLVIERERLNTERDALRYYVDESTQILFERWFHCENLGTQLTPIIEEFFNSKEYKTGLPSKDSVNISPPYFPDDYIALKMPFDLTEWLKINEIKINDEKQVKLFENSTSKVVVFGGDGKHLICNDCETFLLQLQNSAIIEFDFESDELKVGNTLLIPERERFTLKTKNGYTLAVSMSALNLEI